MELGYQHDGWVGGVCIWEVGDECTTGGDGLPVLGEEGLPAWHMCPGLREGGTRLCVWWRGRGLGSTHSQER